MKDKAVLILFTLLLISITVFAIEQDPLSLELIKARIAPVGEVNIATPGQAKTETVEKVAGAVSAEVIGKKIYESKCSVCHAAGIAGAPKLKDLALWKPRIAQGMDVLFTHVKQGYKAMPPMGTCTECTDEDLKAAIEYMIKP